MMSKSDIDDYDYSECKYLSDINVEDEEIGIHENEPTSFQIKIKRAYFKNKEVMVLIFNDTSVQD